MDLVTLQDLRLDTLEAADMPNTKATTTKNLDRRINRSIKRLYNKLVAVRGQEYYRKNYPPFNTVDNTSDYALPSDFYQLIRVKMSDGTIKRTLEPFMEREAARWEEYRVPGGFPVDVAYVPAPTTLVNPDDTFDAIAGFEEWVICDAAIGLVGKEESDAGELVTRKAEAEAMITALATDRDAGWPERVADASRRGPNYAFGGGMPRYRLRGATGIGGTGQVLTLLWGPAPLWF